jgi:hypothetical protein
MNKFFLSFMISFMISVPLFAQQEDSTQSKVQKKKTAVANPVYYGGNIGLSFGSYFRIAIVPLVGYKLSPKASVGLKLGYEYIEDKRHDPKLTASNYGASIFGRYRVVPQVYLHAEFAYYSYKFKMSDLESDRTWVPFLYLGGGYIQPVGPNVALFVEVLVDVLQDANSPYKAWDPVVSIGVAAGF